MTETSTWGLPRCCPATSGFDTSDRVGSRTCTCAAREPSRDVAVKIARLGPWG